VAEGAEESERRANQLQLLGARRPRQQGCRDQRQQRLISRSASAAAAADLADYAGAGASAGASAGAGATAAAAAVAQGEQQHLQRNLVCS
tara:strand:+ start:727 stop:996 length:270 start_codon:yes stop_codon:yes gene_type:complete